MIGLENEFVKALVNTLVKQDPEARRLYLKSIHNESGQGTQNSKSTREWDYRYNNMLQLSKKYGLKFVKLGRGKLWEAILIRGLDDELYVAFSKKNLNTIIKKGKDSHYLRLLNLFNESLDEMTPLSVQTSLPFDDEEEKDKEDLKQQAIEMLHMMKTNPSKVIVFAFDLSVAPTVEASAFNTNQELVWQEDLTSLIDVNYQSVLEDDNVDPDKRESRNTNETKEDKKRIVKLKS